MPNQQNDDRNRDQNLNESDDLRNQRTPGEDQENEKVTEDAASQSKDSSGTQGSADQNRTGATTGQSNSDLSDKSGSTDSKTSGSNDANKSGSQGNSNR